MTRISDLPEALVEEEIFSKFPLTSLSAVRSTCRTWHYLSRSHIFGKTRNQFLGFMVMKCSLYSIKFDHRRDNEGVLVYPSTKRVSKFEHVDIYKVFHCDGLLLCVIRDNRKRVVWNPYLGETRCIEPIHKFHRFHRSDMFAFGYDDNNNNRNHKILRFLDVSERSSQELSEFFEIYDFSSSSWRVLDVNPGCDMKSSVSLKGNTYFFAREKIKDGEAFLLCFDFTAERFGTRLPLPFQSYTPFFEQSTLSCVRDEHLAVLYQCCYHSEMEIWITTKIEPNAVSWRSFLKVDLKPFPQGFYGGSFFINEEKKVAVVLDFRGSEGTYTSCYQTCYIIGKDGYLESVKFGESPCLSKCRHGCYDPLMVSSYVPSLVQLQTNLRRKRKRDY